MKTYPSIPRYGSDLEGQTFHTYDKLDGSNVRFAWAKVVGWYASASRTQPITERTPILGHAIPLFEATLAEPLERLARERWWEELLVFCEFWGERSFAGWREVHDTEGDLRAEDSRYLAVIDINPYKKGILGPEEYLRLLTPTGVPMPRYLGAQTWNADFIERVRRGEVEGMTTEGVIGKQGSGHKIVRVKAKTQAWIERVKATFAPETARELIES